MDKYICDICGWIYDPAIGVPEQNIKENTPFSELPDSFYCPECGAGKESFSKKEES